MENKEMKMVQLYNVIKGMYREYIGVNENRYCDGEDYKAYTNEELIHEIFDDIMNCEGYLQMDNSVTMVKASSLKELGRNLIYSFVWRVVYDSHKKDVKWAWEK